MWAARPRRDPEIGRWYWLDWIVITHVWRTDRWRVLRIRKLFS
jgi:hypothetical protein